MGVPIPPMLAAYAIPSSSGVASFGSSAFSRTASATGNNMRVVAVFEIHMLSAAEAAMKPNTSLLLELPPKIFTMVRAMRRWAPFR